MRLNAADLACRRGDRLVFSGVDFSIEKGAGLVVTGPNGAGKSSLLRLLAGLLPLEAGRLAFEGGDPDQSLAEQAHYLGHRDPVKPSLSVLENIRFWAGFFGTRQRALDDLLAEVGLGHLGDVPGQYLSAGQRRRLSLARLNAVWRPVWLLDEPNAALDRHGEALLAAMMARHLGSGGIVVAATHERLTLSPASELRLGARESDGALS